MFDFEPFVLACLAVNVEVVGIPFGESELDRGGVGHFESGDGEGPEPGGIEVGVAHGVDRVIGLAGDATEGGFEDFAALAPGFAVGFAEGVTDFVKGAQEVSCRRVIGGKGSHQVLGKLGVIEEGKSFFIEQSDGKASVDLREWVPRFFGSENGHFTVPGPGLDEKVKGSIRVESEVLVTMIDASDGGIVVPDGSFEHIGRFPSKLGVVAVDEDGSKAIGHCGE